MRDKSLIPIEPFQGLYWRDRQWQKHVCPPYDVIPPGREKEYQRISRQNVICLELPARVFPESPYRRAGQLFRKWRQNQILTQSQSPAFYLVEEIFHYQKKTFHRQGVFGLFNLSAPIYRHEKTLAAPKVDRMFCLRNIRANTSAVFILVENREVRNLLDTSRGKRLSQFEFESVKYKLQEISEPEKISTWKEIFSRSRFYIADGHHRLQTAKKFGAKYLLGYFVPTDSPGLLILPTHRVVKVSLELLVRQKKYFFPCSKQKSLLSVYYRKKITNVALRPGYQSEGEKLPAEILKKFLLKDIPAADIVYTHSEEEARKIADEKNCLAYLLPATPLKTVLTYSRKGKILPPKSTYFYPKIIAGLVIYAYDS